MKAQMQNSRVIFPSNRIQQTKESRNKQTVATELREHRADSTRIIGKGLILQLDKHVTCKFVTNTVISVADQVEGRLRSGIQTENFNIVSLAPRLRGGDGKENFADRVTRIAQRRFMAACSPSSLFPLAP